MALTLILLLYLGIGALAAAGSIAISSKYFSPRAEQIVYGMVLAPIAAIYLAFTAHYDAGSAWRLEALVATLFVVAGLLGSRSLALLMLGYAAHGLWDLIHEVSLSHGPSADGASLTPIPLAYGAFCAAYDWCMTAYFYTRRQAWRMAWRAH